MSVEIGRYPEPGEPPAAFKRWYYDAHDFDPDPSVVAQWRTRSVGEFNGPLIKRCEDPIRYVASLRVKKIESLSAYSRVVKIELDYHYFN